MTRRYLNEANSFDGYYEIEERDGRFRWVRYETAEDGEAYVDQGEWADSKAEALRDAADDWGTYLGDESFVIGLGALAASAEREER